MESAKNTAIAAIQEAQASQKDSGSLWWLWVLIGIVVVAGCVCVWYFCFFKKGQGPKGPDDSAKEPAPVAPTLTPEEKAARAEERKKAEEAAWIAEAQKKLEESPVDETEDENGIDVIGVFFQKRAYKIYWFKYDGTDFEKGEIASYTADDGKQYKVMVAIPKIRKDMGARAGDLKTLQKRI